jgi:hypothetical protein
MDAAPTPRECRDGNENQREAGSDHVQRKRQRLALQHEVKLIRERPQPKPKRDGEERCRQNQEDSRDRENDSGG